jgi:tetratricopeptide (TPR) repeat protein
MYRFRISECDAAEACFRAAVDLESGLARPYAGLSFVNYERAYLNLDGNRKNWLQKAFDHAHRAVGTDPLDPMGHWVLGRAHLLARDLNAARRAATEATELNPSYATAQYLLGWVGMQLGERELCEERVTLARRLSPQDPLIYGMRGVLAINHALAGQTDKAVEGAKAALMHPDIHYQANAMCAAIFAVAGETELAAEQLRRVNAVNPKYSVDDFFSTYPFQQGSDIETIRKGLQEAQRIVS